MSMPTRIIIDHTFGAAFIGAMVMTMLYGIATLQAYFYFVSYPKDPTHLKALVCVIWVLDTIHAAFVCQCMYYYLVSNYNNPVVLGIGHWSLFTSTAVNAIIAALAQSFFTLQIFRLSNPKIRWWLASAIGLAVLARFCFGLENVVFFYIKKEFSRLHEITLIAAVPLVVTAVIADVSIALALCVLLHGSRTTSERTNTLVSTLIMYAVNRCLLTSLAVTIDAIIFITAPKTLWFMAINFVVGKLYVNSLLATLNSRHSLRASDKPPMSSIRLSGLVFGRDSSRTDTAKRTITRSRGDDHDGRQKV